MKINNYIFKVMMLMKVIYIYLFLICSLSSCNAQSQSHLIENTSGLFTKDIPSDSNGNPKRFYLKKSETEKIIGLNSLEYGFDSLQIRIWYGLATKDKLQLIVLKKSKSKWSGLYYFLVLNYDSKRDSLVSVTKNIDIKQPKSGWKNFIDTLFNKGILTLPDSHIINDYEDCNDGDGVTIEISTNKNYRIYNYPCLTFQNGIKQAKNVEQIMELIEKEFSFSPLSAK